MFKKYYIGLTIVVFLYNATSAVNLEHRPIMFSSPSFNAFTISNAQWGSPMRSNPALLGYLEDSKTKFLTFGGGIDNSSLDLFNFIRDNQNLMLEHFDDSTIPPPENESVYLDQWFQARQSFTIFEYQSDGLGTSLDYNGTLLYKYNGFGCENTLDYSSAGKMTFNIGYGSSLEINQHIFSSVYYGTILHTGFSYNENQAITNGDDFKKYFIKYEFLNIYKKLRYRPGLSSDAAIGVEYTDIYNLFKTTTTIVALNMIKIGKMTDTSMNLKLYSDITYDKLHIPLFNNAMIGIGIPVTRAESDPNGYTNICFALTGSSMALVIGYQKYWILGFGLRLAFLELGIEYGFANETWGYPLPANKGLSVNLGFAAGINK